MSVCEGKHIVLVGMMGVGKSSVGRVLARQLHRPLLDSDELIEERTGRTVREIWASDGEASFRAIETETLLAMLGDGEPAVLAAAGGVVLAEANRSALTESDAHVVWLLANVDLLVARVKNGVHRPLLDDDPEGILRQMYTDREALYTEVADAVVSVDHRSINEVAQAVLRCAG
ncbi:shikimate kinase [uncultured Ilumatobacter sp.]|uniref:shikimate kinase n=1 Tax=uncultured Ilumatobacter sp. TaxID=879968 RepID=UPI00374E6667